MVSQVLCRARTLHGVKDAVSSLCRHHSTRAPTATNNPTSLIGLRAVAPRCFSNKSDQSASDLHSLYLDQMNEINADREAVFGPSDPALESQDISQLVKTYSDIEPMKRNTEKPPEWDAEEAYTEREALFQFTSEEKSAWASYSSTSKSSRINEQKMLLIKEALAERERIEHAEQMEQSHQATQTSQFTHLNSQQDSITMVDVGNKTSTRRIAKARSVVVFPPEVMEAFVMKEKDMVGPKGPIFETARLAGIMGAK